MESSDKAKGKEVEEKKEKEKEGKGEAQKKKKLVEKVSRKDRFFFTARMKEEKKEKEGQKKDRRPRERQVLGKSGRWVFLLFAVKAELAVCQCCSGSIAEKDGDDGKEAAAAGS